MDKRDDIRLQSRLYIGFITNSDFPLSVMQAQSQTVRWFSLLRVFPLA